MEAPDILTTTRKLEQSGMTRSQSEAIAETIVAAVAPLATREDLEATKADIAALRKETKAGLESLKEQMATKKDLESLKEQMATKTDLESLQEHLATRKEVESVKVWLLTGLLGLTVSLLAVAASIVAYAFRTVV